MIFGGFLASDSVRAGVGLVFHLQLGVALLLGIGFQWMKDFGAVTPHSASFSDLSSTPPAMIPDHTLGIAHDNGGRGREGREVCSQGLRVKSVPLPDPP
jgi:hypothetical protein